MSCEWTKTHGEESCSLYLLSLLNCRIEVPAYLPSQTFSQPVSYHYCDVIMGAMVSQISLNIVYSTDHSGADPRKYQSSASLAFVRGIHR